MIKNKLTKIFLVSAFVIPLSFSLYSLIYGRIPFWYDPARDLLLALDNHSKISLIGQTSGIPGIFYGPYWIWTLSIALLISKDPRVVSFIVLTLPYFIFFPLILSKFKKTFGILISVILWLFFSISFNAYTVQIWNPHLAPLLCLAIIWLLVTANYKDNTWKGYIKPFSAGILGGLLLNIHISFGLSVAVGSFVFLLTARNKFKSLAVFVLGFIILFLPFFVFEIRHGFNQINTIINTVTSADAVVKESSVDKIQIFDLFLKRLSLLLNLPLWLSNFLALAISLTLIIFRYKKKIIFSLVEKNILILTLSIIFALLGIYLITKNPVWDYHFIGVEILFMILLGIAAKKIAAFRYLFLIIALLIVITNVTKTVRDHQADPYKIPSLSTKEHIVDIIYDDAKNDTFSVRIFSPATFTPDFDYLIMSVGERKNKEKLFEGKDPKFVYLIIPWTTEALRKDFIDNRTPNEEYKTIKSWHIADETQILKRYKSQVN